MSTVAPLGDLSYTPNEIDFLRQVPLFGSFSDEELADVAARLTLRTFPAGQLIFKAGDPGDELFIVRSGMVRIFTSHGTGQEVELTRLCAGEFFGDLALLDGAPRSASAVAKVVTVALVLIRTELTDLLRSRPRAAVGMLGVLAGRIRAVDHKLRNVASKNLNDVAENRTMAEKASDVVGKFGGSWAFVMGFLGLVMTWIVAEQLIKRPDPYPFIFLNTLLTLVTTMVAPFIMMSQARRAAKDRVRSDLDYKVNLQNETMASDVKETLEELRKIHIPRQLAYMSSGDPAEPSGLAVRRSSRQTAPPGVPR